MATVTIDEVPEAGSSPIPLIGVRMNDTDETVLVALSYTHDKKWNVTVNGKPQNISGDAEWLQGRTYQVALKRKFEKLSVHVDGLTIYDSREYREDYEQFYQGLEKLMESRNISHFYIGEDKKSEQSNVNVTVSKVLLYNRALEDVEPKTPTKADTVDTPEAEELAPESVPQTSYVSEILPSPVHETPV
ncbi:trans-sialidase, putative, partial [Trypanosoma cruzi marinkellei]